MEESGKIQKLMELCSRLPEENQTYIMNLDKSTTTKTIYAYELIRFNDYMKEKNKFQGDGAGYSAYKEISYDDIIGYLRANIEKGNSISTVQRTRTALNGWFDVLSEIKAVSGNPVCSGKVLENLFWETTGKDPRSVEKKEAVTELSAFMDTVENGTGLSDTQKKYHEKYRRRDIAMISLILDTGIRISEVNELNMEDYDRNYLLLYVRKRAVKIKKETKERLEQYIDQDRARASGDGRLSPLFVTSDGSRLAVRSIQRILKKYSAAGNIPQVVSAEKLREISAEKFYQETGDVQELRNRMGVKSMTAIEKYIK